MDTGHEVHFEELGIAARVLFFYLLDLRVKLLGLFLLGLLFLNHSNYIYHYRGLGYRFGGFKGLGDYSSF